MLDSMLAMSKSIEGEEEIISSIDGIVHNTIPVIRGIKL